MMGHGLRIFGNTMLRKILEPKREEVTGENSIRRSFVLCNAHQILLGCSEQIC
jgi:hypothetical protein